MGNASAFVISGGVGAGNGGSFAPLFFSTVASPGLGVESPIGHLSSGARAATSWRAELSSGHFSVFFDRQVTQGHHEVSSTY